MKKQDIGLAYEISTIDLKQPNFLKATLYVLGIAWIMWVIYILGNIWLGINSLMTI